MSEMNIKIILKHGMVIGVYDVENDKYLQEEFDYKVDNHDQYEEKGDDNKIRFHVDKEDAKVAEKDETLDCGHKVLKSDTYYDIYEHNELPPVMAVCRNCVIVDKEE
jgi:hypothetical protein